MPQADGMINQTEFSAKLTADGTWQFYLLVC
jgi:hypothetical protein